MGFSNAVISGMYSFHASASAYTEYWNNSFGSMDSSKVWVTRRQIWQAFVQESIRSIASMSKINLELKDQLPIKEVTVGAFSILGEKGRIRSAQGHECSECTQPYKEKPEFIPQQDPAALVGVDENQRVPGLESGNPIVATESYSPEDNNMDVDSDMDMDVDIDHAPVKMVVMDGIAMGPTIWIIIVVEHFVQLILLPMVHVVMCMAAKARKSIKLKHVRSIRRSGLNINKSIAGKL
ncbi:hypothetical protein BD779DRAFT_1479291 [Infundibulicybe gibba]|nr:hypothetical protein BD779DRAFT_1479291 [Infundibulicybe gibba]